MKRNIYIICTFICGGCAALVLWLWFRPEQNIVLSFHEPRTSLARSIPMAVHNGSLFVQGLINGKPAVMMIDTGANVCVVDEDKLEKFSLARAGTTRKVRLAGEASVSSHLLEEFTIAFPSVGLTAVIHQADCTRINPVKGLDYDCLLGGDFLSAIEAAIDYQTKELLIQAEGPAVGSRERAEQ